MRSPYARSIVVFCAVLMVGVQYQGSLNALTPFKDMLLAEDEENNHRVNEDAQRTEKMRNETIRLLEEKRQAMLLRSTQQKSPGANSMEVKTDAQNADKFLKEAEPQDKAAKMQRIFDLMKASGLSVDDLTKAGTSNNEMKPTQEDNTPQEKSEDKRSKDKKPRIIRDNPPPKRSEVNDDQKSKHNQDKDQTNKVDMAKKEQTKQAEKSKVKEEEPKQAGKDDNDNKQEGDKPLNVLILYPDDWRHDDIGGVAPVVRTPFLNELASNGIRFTHNMVRTLRGSKLSSGCHFTAIPIISALVRF